MKQKKMKTKNEMSRQPAKAIAAGERFNLKKEQEDKA
jgi:hypothetical protein